jgi:hypothetical protein
VVAGGAGPAAGAAATAVLTPPLPALPPSCSTGDAAGAAAPSPHATFAEPGPPPALAAAAGSAARALAGERATYLARHRAAGPAWLALVPAAALDADASAAREVASLGSAWTHARRASCRSGA